MSLGKVSTKKYLKKHISTKLKVEEYVLEIAGKDILDANVVYSMDLIESVIYKEGKIYDNITEPIITIELNGKDKEGNTAWICFELKTDTDYLNTLSKEPTDITSLSTENESFIKKPYNELSEFLDFTLPTNTEDDIYKNLTSLWISKISKNEFIIKLCVPNEVFTYFKIVFNN